VVTPHNIQYDAITDDSSGEDSSPDFFWASATKITERGCLGPLDRQFLVKLSYAFQR
jgi:hypothetical protein